MRGVVPAPAECQCRQRFIPPFFPGEPFGDSCSLLATCAPDHKPGGSACCHWNRASGHQPGREGVVYHLRPTSGSGSEPGAADHTSPCTASRPARCPCPACAVSGGVKSAPPPPPPSPPSTMQSIQSESGERARKLAVLPSAAGRHPNCLEGCTSRICSCCPLTAAAACWAAVAQPAPAAWAACSTTHATLSANNHSKSCPCDVQLWANWTAVAVVAAGSWPDGATVGGATGGGGAAGRRARGGIRAAARGVRAAAGARDGGTWSESFCCCRACSPAFCC